MRTRTSGSATLVVGSWLFVAVLAWAVLGGRNCAWGVDIVAHRGASEDAPENTLAAYQLAWVQKADAIEGDFRYTRDKRVICMHDATTERTTDRKAKAAELTFAEIRGLDAGSWKNAAFKDERVPTLDEVLAVVPKGKRLFLEIKAGAQIVPDIRRRIEASGLTPDQIVIIGFDEKMIAAAKKAMPSIKAMWLYSFKKKDGKWSATHDEIMATLKRTNADGLDVGFTEESLETVNEGLAAKLREAKLELHVWTVDDLTLAKRAIELGAASITTNRPGRLRAELGAEVRN